MAVCNETHKTSDRREKDKSEFSPKLIIGVSFEKLGKDLGELQTLFRTA